MKSNMMTGLIVLGAAMVAGIAGYFVGKQATEARYAELQETFDELSVRYGEMEMIANREIEKNIHLMNEIEGHIDRSLDKSSRLIHEALDEDELMAPIPPIQALREKPQLMELTRRYTNPDGDDEDDEEEYGPDDEAGEPREISPSDAALLDGTTITYYSKDHCLLDGREDLIDDPVSVIGNKLWEELGEREEDVVYVWNPEYATMYEVIVNHDVGYREDY